MLICQPSKKKSSQNKQKEKEVERRSYKACGVGEKKGGCVAVSKGKELMDSGEGGGDSFCSYIKLRGGESGASR